VVRTEPERLDENPFRGRIETVFDRCPIVVAHIRPHRLMGVRRQLLEKLRAHLEAGPRHMDFNP